MPPEDFCHRSTDRRRISRYLRKHIPVAVAADLRVKSAAFPFKRTSVSLETRLRCVLSGEHIYLDARTRSPTTFLSSRIECRRSKVDEYWRSFAKPLSWGPWQYCRGSFGPRVVTACPREVSSLSLKLGNKCRDMLTRSINIYQRSYYTFTSQSSVI